MDSSIRMAFDGDSCRRRERDPRICYQQCTHRCRNVMDILPPSIPVPRKRPDGINDAGQIVGTAAGSGFGGP
jgi:hypothetical protein